MIVGEITRLRQKRNKYKSEAEICGERLITKETGTWVNQNSPKCQV